MRQDLFFKSIVESLLFEEVDHRRALQSKMDLRHEP